MAKTIASAWGRDTTRTKETHRLGSVSSTAEVATWRTFIRSHINADGSGYLTIKRDGNIIHRFEVEAEDYI